MRASRISIPLITLVLTLVGAVQAQTIYPFFELTDEDLERIDVTDGSIDDWLDVWGDAPLSALDFHPLGGVTKPYDPVDLDFRLWLGWHDATDRIYVAMERADDIYVNPYSRSTPFLRYMQFYDSGIEFRIDAAASGDSGYRTGFDNPTSEFYLLVNQRTQLYGIIGETYDEGPHLQLMNFVIGAPSSPHGDWYLRPPYAEAGGTSFGERPTISVTEFYLTPFDHFVWNDPAASLASDLQVDKRILFH